MRNTFFLLAAVIAAYGLSSAPRAAAANDLSWTVVNQLDQLEPYTNAQVFHAGLLWSGRSRTNHAPGNYTIEAYSPQTLQLVASAGLPHCLTHIYPFGPDSVLVLGKTSDPSWETYYSIVTYAATTGKLSVATHIFPETYAAEEYAGDVSRGLKFFSDPGAGGLFVADTNSNTQITLPYGGIIPDQSKFPAVEWRTPCHPTEPGDLLDDSNSESFNSPNYFGQKLHAPTQMLLLKNYLYVVEANSGDRQKQNLVRIDVRNEGMDRTFKTAFRDGLYNLSTVPGTSWIATAERWANQVLAIDPATNQLTQTVAVSGTPWDLKPFGHCLAVLSVQAPKITFLDGSSGSLRSVGTWDLTAGIDRFHRARALALDATTGTAFVRSVEACPTSNCATSFNDTRAFRQASGEIQKLCLN